MADRRRRSLPISLGLVIVVADLYWTYTSYPDPLWLALGIVILAASLIWIYVDL
jgi:membrane protein YdbS with pleckstrin-like domain